MYYYFSLHGFKDEWPAFVEVAKAAGYQRVSHNSGKEVSWNWYDQLSDKKFICVIDPDKKRVHVGKKKAFSGFNLHGVSQWWHVIPVEPEEPDDVSPDPPWADDDIQMKARYERMNQPVPTVECILPDDVKQFMEAKRLHEYQARALFGIPKEPVVRDGKYASKAQALSDPDVRAYLRKHDIDPDEYRKAYLSAANNFMVRADSDCTRLEQVKAVFDQLNNKPVTPDVTNSEPIKFRIDEIPKIVTAVRARALRTSHGIPGRIRPRIVSLNAQPDPARVDGSRAKIAGGGKPART